MTTTAPALSTAPATAVPSTETVALYNRGKQTFVFVHEPPPRMRRTVLGPNKNVDVSLEVWNHWQTTLGRDHLADIVPGGAAPLPVAEVVAAKDAIIDAKQAKLDAALKQVENLSGILAKLQADQAQGKLAQAGRR